MTSKITLSDSMLKSLKVPAAGVTYYPDAKIAGFGIRVSKHGRKTFYFTYRFKDQRPRLTLGHYPKLTLADARRLAGEAAGLLYRGLDPSLHLRITEDESHASADVTPDANQAPLFTDALKAYIEKHLATNCKQSTCTEVSRLLTADFLPTWAAIPIDQITPYHVAEIIDAKLAKGAPSAANHARKDIKSFFSWCVARKMIKVSPAASIPKPAKTGTRNRYLTAKEIRALWNATEEGTNPLAKLIRLSLLTGQRRGELAGMRWDEIHIRKGYWEIPSARTKNGRAHVVPLSFLAIEILKSITQTPLPLQPGDTEIRYSPYVFPSPRAPAKPIKYFGSKDQIEKLANIDPWCIHDLRRTLTTGLAEIGTAPKVKKKIVNHAENEVHDLYDRFEYFKERCEAMHLWALYVKKAIAGEIEATTIADYQNPFIDTDEPASP